MRPLEFTTMRDLNGRGIGHLRIAERIGEDKPPPRTDAVDVRLPPAC